MFSGGSYRSHVPGGEIERHDAPNPECACGPTARHSYYFDGRTGEEVPVVIVTHRPFPAEVARHHALLAPTVED